MPYTINGQTASLAPYEQTWVDSAQGKDHTGRPIYAAVKSVTLRFDACTYGSYQQWAQFQGTSLTSVQVLNLDGGSFTSYTGASLFLEINPRPTFQAGYVGQWTAIISGIPVT